MGYKEILQKRLAEAANSNIVEESIPLELEDSEELSQKHKFFGIENVKRFPSCLDLRLPNGNSKALPYSFIVEINFDISEGIEIVTSTKKIIISGRNLQLLYSYLVAFRLTYIQANIGNDLSKEDVLFVKGISIEEI